MDIYTLLIFGHIIGTAMGLGGSIIAEVQIGKALKDGIVAPDERALMHADYFVIRAGIVLIVISGLGLIAWYLAQGSDWVLTSSKLWAKDLMLLVIIFNAVALSKRWVPLWLGSAVSLGSWLAATGLGVWRDVPYSFGQILVGYVIFIALVAVILHFVKKFLSRAS